MEGIRQSLRMVLAGDALGCRITGTHHSLIDRVRLREGLGKLCLDCERRSESSHKSCSGVEVSMRAAWCKFERSASA